MVSMERKNTLHTTPVAMMQATLCHSSSGWTNAMLDELIVFVWAGAPRQLYFSPAESDAKVDA